MKKIIKIIVCVLVVFVTLEVFYTNISLGTGFCNPVGPVDPDQCKWCPPCCPGGGCGCACTTNFCANLGTESSPRYYCSKNTCMSDRKWCEQNKNNLIKCDTSADCAGCKSGEEYPILKCDISKQCKLVYECGKSNCKNNQDCCAPGETYPYYTCDYDNSRCITKYECGKSTCKTSDNYTKNWKGETIEQPNPTCTINRWSCNTQNNMCIKDKNGSYNNYTDCSTNCYKYSCNTQTYKCTVSANGSYIGLPECQKNCQSPTSTKPTSKPTTPSSVTTTNTSPGTSSITNTTRRSTTSSTVSTPLEPDDNCRIVDFDITPHLASLLALSDGRAHFIADWWSNNCNSCELWYLPVDQDRQPLRDKYGNRQEDYIKAGSNLPTSSPDPAFDLDYKSKGDTTNLYEIKNYPQKWGHYLYKLTCQGSDSQDESFPVHIFVAPWMIWYEVPPVMPTSKFHTIITSPGWGQSIEEYKGY